MLSAAASMSTFMAFPMMLMMAAGRIRIIRKLSVQKSPYFLIRIPGYAAEDLDSRFLKRFPGAASNASAKKNLNSSFLQKTGQCSIPSFYYPNFP